MAPRNRSFVDDPETPAGHAVVPFDDGTGDSLTFDRRGDVTVRYFNKSGDTRGGQRGGGNKPNSVKFAGTWAKVHRRIAEKLPELFEAEIGLALGVFCQRLDDDGNPMVAEDGEPVVYQKPPNLRAIEALLNRHMGPPQTTAKIEHSQGETTTAIQVDIKGLPQDDLRTLARIARQLAGDRPE